MDIIIPALILLTIIIASTYYVAQPFLLAPATGQIDETFARRTALQLEKVNLYRQLRETEFEHQMGMTAVGDFERTRTDLLSEVHDVATALDQMDIGNGSSDAPAAASSLTVCPQCGGKVAPDDNFCGHCGHTLSGKCDNCGTPYVPGDRFCNSCGRGLLHE